MSEWQTNAFALLPERRDKLYIVTSKVKVRELKLCIAVVVRRITLAMAKFQRNKALAHYYRIDNTIYNNVISCFHVIYEVRRINSCVGGVVQCLNYTLPKTEKLE